MIADKLTFDENDLSDADRQRFHDLFNKLDTNKDGTVDVLELAAALRGRKDAQGQASVCLIDGL
jgi:Ca2+-binding EF-hand superfamily protein